MLPATLLEGGIGYSSGNSGEIGTFFFLIFLIALPIGGLLFLIGIVMALSYKKDINQKEEKPQHKKVMKAALWFFLIAICSALLTAIFCSSH